MIELLLLDDCRCVKDFVRILSVLLKMHGRGAHFLCLGESVARREHLLGPVMRTQRLKEP